MIGGSQDNSFKYSLTLVEVSKSQLMIVETNLVVALGLYFAVRVSSSSSSSLLMETVLTDTLAFFAYSILSKDLHF